MALNSAKTLFFLAGCGALTALGGHAARASSAPIEIDEYQVDGNTVLPDTDIEASVYPYLGPGKHGSDIDAARAALQKLYQDRGYQTVQVVLANPVPEDGVVHLRVVELTVGRLRVVGSHYYALSEIRAEAPSVKEGVVPNFHALRGDLVTLNRLMPDRTVTPAVKAGHLPGTVDVDLLVKDEPPMHVEAEVNNQRTVSTSELRTGGTVSYENLWQQGHRLSLSVQTAPLRTQDSRVVSATYLARILGTPYSLQVTGSQSDSDVSVSSVTVAGGTTAIGNGTTVGVRGIIDLPGSDRVSHSAEAGIDFKHTRNKTLFGDPTTGTNSSVPVTYFPATASYTLNLRESAATDSTTVSLNLAPARAGSSGVIIDDNRYKARGQNFFVRLSAERDQDLPRGFGINLRAAGQLADQPLMTGEQFSLGGIQSVRGYYESEKLVDNGISGSLELVSPPIQKDISFLSLGDRVDTLRLIAFLDGGRGVLLSPPPQQHASFALASTGLGGNIRLFQHVDGSLYWARPLLATTDTPAGTQLFLFTVSTEY